MTKARNVLRLAAWHILATILLARLWLTHPDVGPHAPLPFAQWLVEFYGSKDGENLADLETLFVLLVSFIVVTALTAIFYLIKRRLLSNT